VRSCVDYYLMPGGRSRVPVLSVNGKPTEVAMPEWQPSSTQDGYDVWRVELPTTQ
jgi:hypothetical protein